MKKTLFAALVAGLLLAPTAAARTATASYEIAFQNLTGAQADPAGLTDDGTIDYGGVRFAAMPGETSVTITVSDSAGGNPYTIVCQDADLDLVCGEPGEPRVAGCGPLSTAISPSGGDVTVFVSLESAVVASIGQQSATPLPCGEPTFATSGTVTAVFS